MKKNKIKRFIVMVVILFISYLLQCTVFQKLTLASIKPNLLLIITASIGFMRGQKEGMFLGFFSGLLIDIQFGTMLGFYALIYLIVGYINDEKDNIKISDNDFQLITNWLLAKSYSPYPNNESEFDSWIDMVIKGIPCLENLASSKI